MPFVALSDSNGKVYNYHLFFLPFLKLPGGCNELRILTSLNLAIVYLRNKREKELNELLTNLNPESLHSTYVSVNFNRNWFHNRIFVFCF